jgi:hypothetical protein
MLIFFVITALDCQEQTLPRIVLRSCAAALRIGTIQKAAVGPLFVLQASYEPLSHSLFGHYLTSHSFS